MQQVELQRADEELQGVRVQLQQLNEGQQQQVPSGQDEEVRPFGKAMLDNLERTEAGAFLSELLSGGQSSTAGAGLEEREQLADFAVGARRALTLVMEHAYLLPLLHSLSEGGNALGRQQDSGLEGAEQAGRFPSSSAGGGAGAELHGPFDSTASSQRRHTAGELG